MAINVKKLAQLGMEVITDTFQSDVPQDQHAKTGMKLISDALQPEIQEQWWFKNPWVTWVTSFDDDQQKKKYRTTQMSALEKNITILKKSLDLAG